MRRLIEGVRGRVSLFLAAAGLILALSVEGLAQTPRIQGQGAAASGMGNAFTAQADDPSAVHYNPAGMTQLRGVQNMFGALILGGPTTFASPTGANATGDRGGSVAWPLPGHFYLTGNLKDLGVGEKLDLPELDNVTVGIGVTTPLGSLSQYPMNGPFRTAVYYATIPLIDIKPTVAYKVNDQLSLGLGMDIYTFSSLFGEGHLEQKSIWPGGLGVPAGSQVELYGSDTAVGFNASFLYTPFRNAEGKPLLNLGFVFRSQARLDLKGQFLANGARVADAYASYVLPPVYSGGLAYWPVRDTDHEWKVEADVDYVGWDVNQNVDVTLSNGSRIAQPQQWRNAFNAMVGTEYRWLKLERMKDWELAARAGYTNLQTQVPDSTFNPGTPSADVHIPSVGVGFLCARSGNFLGFIPCGGSGTFAPKAIGLDLAYQYALYEQRTITGNQNATVNGTYKTEVHVGSFSIRFLY